MAYAFRSMQEDDLPAVLAIEQCSFADPWPEEAFLPELGFDNYVTLAGEILIGYICVMQVLDECSITNIAVHPDWRRQGIAHYMFERLYKIMDTRAVLQYFLEVRASNASAIALYDKLGFKQIGVRKEYYRKPVEDAIVFALRRDTRMNG